MAKNKNAPVSATGRGINFVLSPSANYAKVQEQILGIVKKDLPQGGFTHTISERDPERINFTLFIRQPTDVLMSHGVADKNYFFRKDKNGDRIAQTLKHAFVPGEWLKARILASPALGFTPDRVHTVHWPRLDSLFEQQRAYEAEMAGREPRKRPKVLWAPTHDYARRGEDEVSTSSYPELLDHMDELSKHFDVEVSLHPRNRKDKQPTHNQLIDCDYVISDFGTMVYEAWALGKPVIFPYWIIGERVKTHLRKAAEAHIFRERIGIHADSVKDIVDAVMGGAGIDAKVTAFLNDYLAPEYRGKSGTRIAQLLQTLPV